MLFSISGLLTFVGFPCGQWSGIHLPMQETQVRPLGWGDPLEKDVATHSSILAWKNPWTKDAGRLQSMESDRVRHDWVSKHHHQHLWFVQLRPCFLGRKDNFNLFSFWITLISFSCLIALARRFSSLLNSCVECVHPCPLLNLRGKAFILSPLSMMLGVFLSCIGFIYVEVVYCFSFVECYIWGNCWIFPQEFFASTEMIVCFFFVCFILLSWCIILIDFCTLSHPCLTGIKSSWSWCQIFSGLGIKIMLAILIEFGSVFF